MQEILFLSPRKVWNSQIEISVIILILKRSLIELSKSLEKFDDKKFDFELLNGQKSGQFTRAD